MGDRAGSSPVIRTFISADVVSAEISVFLYSIIFSFRRNGTMTTSVENLEKNMVMITVTVEADKMSSAMKKAYEKIKNKVSVPGFRKGKVPMNMVEKMYGAEVFFQDAADILIDESYSQAIEESGVDVVSRPEVGVTQIEKDKDFIYTIKVAKRPEVKLGEYKGVAVTEEEIKVTADEVEEMIKQELDRDSRISTDETGKAVEVGDRAVIDFKGFVDGEAFAGGEGKDYALEIGSHSFIDTFEDQIVGHKVGDEFDVNVTFPEDYSAAELAGKPAKFEVKVNEIKVKEAPTLDDEYVSDHTDFETVDEYKADIEKKIKERKENQQRGAQEDEAISAIIEASEMDIPDAMIDLQVENMVEEFEQRLSYQGLSFAQYMQMSGQSIDKVKEQMKPDAITRIKSSLVLEEIAKVEKLEASDEDVQKEIQDMANMYGMDVSQIEGYITDAQKKQMARDVQIKKAVNFVVDNAKKSKAKKTTKRTTKKKAEEKAETTEE